MCITWEDIGIVEAVSTISRSVVTTTATIATVATAICPTCQTPSRSAAEGCETCCEEGDDEKTPYRSEVELGRNRRNEGQNLAERMTEKNREKKEEEVL